MQLGFEAITAEASEALLERPMLQLALLDALHEKNALQDSSEKLEVERRQRLQLERELADLRKRRAIEAEEVPAKSDPKLELELERARRLKVEEQLENLKRASHAKPTETQPSSAQRADAPLDECLRPSPIRVQAIDDDRPAEERPAPATISAKLARTPVRNESSGLFSSPLPQRSRPRAGGFVPPSPLAKAISSAAESFTVSDPPVPSAESRIAADAAQSHVPKPPDALPTRPVGAPPKGPSRAERMQRQATSIVDVADGSGRSGVTSATYVKPSAPASLTIEPGFATVVEREVSSGHNGVSRDVHKEVVAPPQRRASRDL